MKEFKIFVGLSEDNMTEVLHAGLRNDSVPETFAIRHANRAGGLFPTRYVKIVPLSAHGQSFHTSIWYVALSGISDPSFVEQVRQKHDEYRETSVMRHVLKHLRQRRFLSPYDSILSRTGLTLEHALITSLHEASVLHGDWARAEELVRSASDAGLLASFRHACQPHAQWTRLRGLDADGDVPRRRGGHAMCMDTQGGLVYLFGGWDGQRSLDDFWVYDVARDTWRELSPATSREKNGPGPRACHKMVFDTKTGAIYLLGRLGDGDALESHAVTDADTTDATVGTGPSEVNWRVLSPDSRRSTPPVEPPASAWSSYCSEFYRYHTRGLDAGSWTFCHSTLGRRAIYVHGGRIVDGEWKSLKYSGLYRYDVRTSNWKMLDAGDASTSHPSIPSRYGHSMVLDTITSTLFIFAGQRDDRYLSDMYSFHIPTGTMTELFSNFTAFGGPDACFTQRAVIDPELREIYVFCGLTRARPGSMTVLAAESPNWIYRYERWDLPGKWAKIPSVESKSEASELPQPRYAHQVVYNHITKTSFMHGGNAGIKSEDSAGFGDLEDTEERMEVERRADDDDTGSDGGKENRLDDFWQMQLIRPSPDEIVRRACFEIRQQQFREMCEDGPAIQALTFLQTQVSSVVDHSDVEETKTFRSLLSYLLAAPPQPTPTRSGTPAASGSGSGMDGEDSSPSWIRSSSDSLVDVHTSSSKRSRPEAASPSVVRMEEDPVETTAGHTAPSPARFHQRTQLFERLLAFVNEDAKQPDENLLDLVNMNG
ncbi:Muskelin [Grifola frondosa]|uniref:Muskelin n=1 Tax=Grifola frondosa TaxID=5627 RepID=A0A1C7M0T0_GRIFR|nr:Muskelin [Grifola frondosa]